jgi:hypothetical protein
MNPILVLINDWPCDDGQEYVAAVKAYVDTIGGNIAPEQFREALVRAADEAGIAALCSFGADSRLATFGAASWEADIPQSG